MGNRESSESKRKGEKMKKQILVSSCSQCPFNEHGQEDRIPIMETYLGKVIKVYIGTRFGMPMLYCMYDPKESFRENMRQVTHGFGLPKLIIWIAGDSRFEGEFERQLNGFPKRCPLEDAK